MKSIKKVIKAARTAGHALEPGIGTYLTPIAVQTWFQPNTGNVIRNEGGKLPYVIYNLKGDRLGSTKTLTIARAFGPVPMNEKGKILKPNLYAYEWDGNERGYDPHAIQLHIRPRITLTKEWQRVTDQITGEDFDVRSAPCGAGCHCAADAFRIVENVVQWRHENGMLLDGVIVGDGVGPRAASYVTMEVSPTTMTKAGIDREPRHREEGMRRQVLRSRIIQ